MPKEAPEAVRVSPAGASRQGRPSLIGLLASKTSPTGD